MATFYKEFFRPKADYKPVMTKEGINATPDTWLSFYPHQTFVKILETLFQKFENGDRSVWIYGAYGTGKSHAALVIQKLFMDDEKRVLKYCADFKKEIPTPIADGLKKWRKQKSLVVYRCGTDQVSTPQQLLVGIERSIREECRALGYSVPSLSGYETLLARIERDEKVFFAKRDEIQSELANLTSDIKTYAQIKARCEKDDGKFSSGILQDAEKVFEYDNVFLMPGAEKVLDWIKEIREANGLGKIVFIWDEFSSYIDHAKGDLKTFEKLAEEKAQQCGFHFVPVTHMDLNAFLAVGSESAKKANDRYTPCPLQIPANQVFRLGAHAFTHLKEDEWKLEHDKLWSNVSPVVDSYMLKHMPSSEAVGSEDFKQILPLHPMSAYLLRHMSEKVGSNARSFFDYLCATSGQSEFQKFLEEGGPAVANHQYLMVDYLWRYFMERPDLGLDSAVRDIETDFNAKKSALQLEDGSPEERVYKAVLLYSLMEKKSGQGVQDLLSPTVENIEKSFYGDGTVVNVRAILKSLEEKNCFSIVSDRVMPLISGAKVDPAKFRGEFTTLVASDIGADIKKRVDGYGDTARYEVRAYHGPDFKPSDVKNRSDFGEGTPKGGNKILINCLLACNHEGTISIPEKARQMAKQFSGMRIIFLYLNNISFCDENESLWEDYILLRAQADAATDQGMRGAYEGRAKKILDKWKDRVCSGSTDITIVIPAENASDEPTIEQGVTWLSLKGRLNEQKLRWFYSSPDKFTFDNPQLYKPMSLKAWAQAGLTGQSPINGGPYKAYIQRLATQGVTFADDWFESNPDHPFAKLRDFWEKKRQNTIGQNGVCSVRRQYKELLRAPYGFEKNAFAAFAIGFAMRNWLTKNLQWTDDRISQPLDVDSLSEIIEAVVLDDGEDKIKDEKKICRLSEEEKTFTKQIADVFSLTIDKSATPESVLAKIGERIRVLTGNIPLWVLPPYIRDQKTETAAENICKVVESLCEVIPMSSKSKDGSKTEKVKAIGEILLKNEGLCAAIQKYITPEVFTNAFDKYIGIKAPGLPKAAVDAGDLGGEYRKTIVTRFSMDASWLWNEVDVSGVLKDVENQYKFILSMQEMFSVSSWMNFETAQDKLHKSMTEYNKVSLDILAATYPFVAELREQVKDSKIQGESLEKLCLSVTTQKSVIQNLFRDPAMKLPIEILAKNLGDDVSDISYEEWKQILDARQGGAELGEADFRGAMFTLIKAFREKSEGRKLMLLWKDMTGSDDPDLWSAQHMYPADVLFAHPADARLILVTIRGLAEASVEKIKDACKVLKKAKLHNEDKQKAVFLERNLPKRYAKLNIKAEDLAMYFASKLGADPNSWWNNPAREDAVMDFVKSNYDSSFRPDIESKIKKMSADKAKAELLKLIASIPDAGIALMN